jgi:hypothetical protein
MQSLSRALSARFRSRSAHVSSLALVAVAALASGCATTSSSFVDSDTTLGRVIVYRNGVAYYERYAHVDGGELKLAVPADKVDDFLKSLTVVDAKSGKPTPVSYPTSGTSADSEGLVRMTIQVPKDGSQDLKLSYVTETPSWKPSYRITLGKGKKVDLQGWAIVDNTSGEDWKNVKLGVGSSSALSFRFDLRSVRLVERETLRSDLPFAMAPPTGQSSYGQGGQPQTTTVLGEISDEALNRRVAAREPPKEEPKRVVVSGKSEDVRKREAGGGGRVAANKKPADAPATAQEQARRPANDPVDLLTAQLRGNTNEVVVEGYAGKDDADKNAASLDRANRLRDQLIQNGIAPERVVAVGSGEKAGHDASVRVVQRPPEGAKRGAGFDDGALKTGERDGEPSASSLAPIGTSHFESKTPMSVARGTSAMVSIYAGTTDGEVVYLYDSETQRGNARFPFKSVRIQNPTDSALEAGPVTVFGDGRFIGEGLSDAIAPKSTAFIPYALDRQIVVERKEATRDEIARVLTVQRGVFSTETKHIRKTALTLENHLAEKATVYVRHSVPEGYKLTKGPQHFERVGTAHLFRVDVEAGGKVDVEIEEATPVFKSTDIRTAEGMKQIKAYVSSAALDAGLQGKVGELVKLQVDQANIEQRIATLREQMGEYRARMDELHAQVVTLKLVKTAGPLMRSLETKLGEMTDRVSKATIDVVGLEEQLMVSRIQFQDKVAELSLEGADKKDKVAIKAP